MPRRINDQLLFWTLASLMLVTTAVHLVHSHQMQRNSGSVFHQAQLAMEEKDFGKAADLLRLYLEYEPDDTDAIACYAVVLEKTSTSVRAQFKRFMLLEQVLRRQPNRQDVRLHAAQAAIEVGRMHDAIRHLQELVTVQPERADLLHKLGWCQEAVGKYDASAKSFRRAIDLAPNQIESYILLADLLDRRLAQPDEAVSIMNQAVAANPESWSAFLARGRFHFAKARPNEAAKDIYQACALAGDNDEVLLAAAEIAVLQHNLADAQKYLDRGLTRFPKNQRRAPVLRNLAAAYLVQGDKGEAETALQQVVKLVPRDFASRALLFDLYLGDQRDAEALQTLDELRRFEGEEGVLWRAGEASRAIAKARKGDRSELELARKRLGEIHERGNWPRAALLQGYLEELEGNTEKALLSYRRAIVWGERQPALALRLAQWLIDHQRFEEAGQLLRELEKQMPLPPAHLRLAAEIELRNGESKLAAALARKAVSPGSRDYRDQLWLAHVQWLAGYDAEAELTLRAAVQSTPRVPDVWIGLVHQLHLGKKVRQMVDAVEEMEQAIPPERLGLAQARCLEATGRQADAETHYQKVLAEKADDFVTVRQVAEFYLRSDQSAKAEPLLQQLLEPGTMAPVDVAMWARRQLAIQLVMRNNLGDLKAAMSLLDKNAGPKGPFVEDERVRAFVLSRAPTRLAESSRVFEQTLGKQSLTPQERFLLIQIYDANSDEAQANRQMQILLAINRDQPEFLVYHIRKLLDHGQTDMAQPYLNLLEQLEPDSPRTRQLLNAGRKAPAKG